MADQWHADPTPSGPVVSQTNGARWLVSLTKALVSLSADLIPGGAISTALMSEREKKRLGRARAAGEEQAEERTARKELVALLQILTKLGVDPAVFDSLVANEVDRRLKTRFGGWFLILTVLVTAASYAIVVLDGALNWGISQVAITALIIETPIQFIGLLYIIARNLFPQRPQEGDKSPAAVDHRSEPSMPPIGANSEPSPTREHARRRAANRARGVQASTKDAQTRKKSH